MADLTGGRHRGATVLVTFCAGEACSRKLPPWPAFCGPENCSAYSPWRSNLARRRGGVGALTCRNRAAPRTPTVCRTAPFLATATTRKSALTSSFVWWQVQGPNLGRLSPRFYTHLPNPLHPGLTSATA